MNNLGSHHELASKPPPSRRPRSSFGGLTPVESGWNPRTWRNLLSLLRPPQLKGRTAVFDFDGTLASHDINEATIEALQLRGRLALRSLHGSLAAAIGEVALDPRRTIAQNCAEYMSRLAANTDKSRALEALYRWSVQIYSGLTPLDIVEATAEVIGGKVPLTTFKRPAIFPEMLDLITALHRKEAQVWIITASNPWSVRWAVQQEINPVLRENGVGEIALQNVIGLATTLRDRDGRIRSDRELATSIPAYAALDPEILRSLTLTDTLGGPTPTFDGKADACRTELPALPLLAAGDSRNDFAMLRLAEHALWIAHHSKRELLNEIRVATKKRCMLQYVEKGGERFSSARYMRQ